MWRITACGVLGSLLLALAWIAPAAEQEIDAAAYLVEAQDELLWVHRIDARLPPASLTKIMAALLVLEDYRPEEVVTVGQAAAAETGTRLGLRRGQRLRVADLLAATPLRSANDACHALADWRAGSEARFVTLMNRRAEELGPRETHFTNACGHDHPRHLSSARDLAMLARAALREPVFTALVAQPRARFQSVDGRRGDEVENSNALIGSFPGVLGVKTGYTPRAGPCLVALAERDGVRVLLVLLNAPNRWWDAEALFERAFDHIQARAAARG